MADKVTKRKPKAKREKASVLGNLPATRPQRLGRPRTDTAEVTEAVTPPEPAAPVKRELPRHKPPVGPARVEASAAASRANGAAAKPAARRAAAKPAARAKAAPPKPEPSPASAAESTPAPAPAKPARRRASQAGTRRKPATATSADTRRRTSSHEPPRATPRRRPAAVRPGARPLESPQRVGDPPPARAVQAPRGTELVTTAIQAAGELAQIGLTVGGRALKRAVDRLPRP